MSFARAAGITAVLALAVTAVSAQVVGGLTVLVSDESGPLPGATVTISSATKQIRAYSEMTDKNGRVVFPVLKAVSGYIIEVSVPGFGTRRRDDVKVKAGENQLLEITLAEQYTEKVKVTAQREVVDLEKTTTSSKFSDDFISDLPVPGRFYQNILTLAPGVNDDDGDGNVTVHGSRARDFKTMVNGVSNVDPLTGQFMANVNPNSIEEMEVITAGAGPEYGRAQGGFANIIQKQGGNEFEGVFDFLWRSSKLDGDGAVTVPADRVPTFDWYQPSVQVSGPIVKDRLWYRLSHELIDREDPVNTTAGIVAVKIEQEITSDQITWQVSDRNKLAFKFDSNPRDVTNLGVSSLTPIESAQIWTWDADTYAVTWSAPYSPQIYIESTASWLDGGRGFLPTTRGLGNDCLEGLPFLVDAQCTNAETGETSGSYWRDWDDSRQRFALQSDATIYSKKKFLGMNHEFKFGLSIENERYVRDLVERARVFFFVLTPIDTETGGQQNIDPVGVALTSFSIPPETRARATGTIWGIYFKDQMKPLQNLTIEVGARLDREVVNSNGMQPLDPAAEFQLYNELIAQGRTPTQARTQAFTGFEALVPFRAQLAQLLNIPNANALFGPIANQGSAQPFRRQPLDINITNTNLAPFLAMTWDPWSNGKTKFGFTAGRHYNNIPLSVPTEEIRPTRASVGLTARRAGGRWITEDLLASGRKINPAASLNVVDRDLATPYQDEFTFTFQRELWAETSIEVNYVNRKYRDQLQDLDVNNAPGDYGTCVVARKAGDPAIDFSTGPDGIIDDCTGRFFIPEPDGNADPDPFGREGRVEQPDGIPDLYRLNPFWGPIYVIGNFNSADYEGVTVALNRRQYRGWEMQTSYTWSMARGNGEDYNQFLGDDQSTQDNEFGFQSNDRRHVVKVSATTITPWGVRLGGRVQWQSGLPYSLLQVRSSIDAIPPTIGDFGQNESRQRWYYPTGIRNDQRNVSYWDFQVRAAKEFNLGRGMNMQLAAEIYNVLNDGTYIVYNPFEERGLQINGQNEATRRFGRQFQMSMKLSF